MGITRENRAITFDSGSGSKTISSSTRVYSDAMTLNDADTHVAVQVKADNQGTPALGDYVDVYIHWSPDEGTTYDTDEHGEKLGRLDTYSTNTPGEDPATASWDLGPGRGLMYKLSFLAPQAASRNIVVTCREFALRSA